MQEKVMPIAMAGPMSKCRLYLILMIGLVFYHVLELAGLFGHHN